MPLGDFEREVLRLLAANRNPDSFVGGATVLHQSSDSPRASKDVDYFHDTMESLAASVDRDVGTLRAEAALELIARLPASELGCLYLDDAGRPVCPDPGSNAFGRLTRHFGTVKGAWPRIAEA